MIPHMIKTISMAFVTLLMVSLFHNSASAQNNLPEARAQNLTDTMICELGLSASQQPDIYKINLNAAKQMDSEKVNCGYNSFMLDQLGKEVDKKRNIALRDALNPRQFSIYERISKGNKRMLRKTAQCRYRNPDNAKLESCAF